ncbi:MAG: hypothetical protein ACI4D7_03175 [Lachnospiraceae bacterium]
MSITYKDEIVYENGHIILNRPITPKENFIRAVRHENPMWIPMRSDGINFTPSIYPDNVARAFVIEGKKYDGPVGGEDIFGVKWTFIETVGGSMVEPGSPFLEDIADWKSKVVFPDLDSWDWEKSAEENREFLKTDKYVLAWIFNGMFERLISFLDFENAAVALIDEDQEEDVREFFQALTDFYKKLIDKFDQYYNIDGIYFHDDWGSQRAPFFSLNTCREMLVPYIKQLVDHCHSKNLIFELHCCGMNEPLVPAMIEAGIDAWCGQPLNNKQMLVETYGDQILIGVHDPFMKEPVPESDEKLQEMVNNYLDPYSSDYKNRPMFIANLKATERTIAEYYRFGRELCSK